MRKFDYKRIVPLLGITLFIFVMSSHTAHAISLNPFEWFNIATIGLNAILDVIAGLAYVTFTLAGWFLAMCGTLLNVGMQITIHLDIFIKSTPIIYTVWTTIRDIASMLLIFFILLAAIQMILGLQHAQYKQLITSIIVAGILINFSFFFTRVAIDASNIVSLEFYNAIAPQQEATYGPNDKLSEVIVRSISDGSGGMAGIFTGALRVTQWWDGKGVFSIKDGSTTNQIIQIIISNYTGAVIEVIAGLSFLAAAIATIWRTVILIFLLGFSSLWIASFAVPKLDEFKKMWMGPFQSNLIFLPVYLALMYVTALIITNSGLSDMIGNYSITEGNSTDIYLKLFITFAFIIIMINIPLVTAIKVSGLSVGWVNKLKGTIGSFGKWASIGVMGAGTSIVGRNVIGRAGSSIEKWSGNQKFSNPIAKAAGALVGIGNSVTARDVRAATTGKLAQSKFGGKRSYKDIVELNKDIKKKDQEIERRKKFGKLLEDARANVPPVLGGDTIKDVIGKMNDKELLSIKLDDLKNPNVIRYLKGKHFDAIDKSDDMSADDKKAIKNARQAVFEKAINDGHEDTVKDMLKSYSGKDLLDIDPGQLIKPAIIKNFTTSQLKEIGDHSTDRKLKKDIGDAIAAWNTYTPNGLSTFGWLQDQRRRGLWL